MAWHGVKQAHTRSHALPCLALQQLTSIYFGDGERDVGHSPGCVFICLFPKQYSTIYCTCLMHLYVRACKQPCMPISIRMIIQLRRVSRRKYLLHEVDVVLELGAAGRKLGGKRRANGCHHDDRRRDDVGCHCQGCDKRYAHTVACKVGSENTTK